VADKTRVVAQPWKPEDVEFGINRSSDISVGTCGDGLKVLRLAAESYGKLPLGTNCVRSSRSVNHVWYPLASDRWTPFLHPPDCDPGYPYPQVQLHTSAQSPAVVLQR
jgi:hypothetical protein